MTDSQPEPKRTRLPLAAQHDKLRRVLKRQSQDYARLHTSGLMDATQRIKADAELDDIWATFTWNVANADWIKAEAMRRAVIAEQARQFAEIEAAERATIEAHPAVAAVTAAFPGSTIRPATEEHHA